jgi:DNA polymerase-3 subunit delta'
MTQNQSWNIYGHSWAVQFLQKSLQNGRVRHAYLITGSHNIGKSLLAHAFASALNCTHEDTMQRPCGVCRSCKLIKSGNHPDILYSVNDEKTGALRIDAIREVMSLIALKPYSSRYRVALFHDFDRAQPRAQDALLKTLEEPPPHAVIIVMAQGLEGILPTIKSRCQVLPLRPVETNTVRQALLDNGAQDEQATLISRLSSGRIGWALQAMTQDSILQERADILEMLNTAIRGNRIVRFGIAEKLSEAASKDRDSLRYLLEMWQTYWRDVLLLAQDSPIKPCNSDRMVDMQQLTQRIQVNDALKALRSTRTMLYQTLNTNANVRLALETLMLDYPRY